MSVLKKIADELRKQKEFSDTALVSLKHTALLSSAFQFFILTCITPYLDKGVGVPLQLRSHIIRSWEKCAGDEDFKTTQLHRAGECIVALLNCTSSVRSELLRRYCSDIICVFEQLKFRGEESMLSQYEQILAMVPPQMLVCNFLGLVKPRTSSETAPSWFTVSIGSRLSSILMGRNGLNITLSAYEEISNGQFWENAPLLSALGKQIALPPRNVKKTFYYKNICEQFFELVNTGKVDREKVVVLFSFFADHLKKKDAFAYETMVEDVLFKPWEAIIASPRSLKWSPSHATALCLLKMMCENKLTSHLLLDCPRFLPAAVILLSVLPISPNDVSPLRNLRSDILGIVTFAVRRLENLTDFLLAFITNSSPCFQLSQEKNLVQIVGEALPIYGKVVLSTIDQSKDEILARRIEITIILLKEFRQAVTSRLFLEIACKSVQMWDNDAEVYDFPRFLDGFGSEYNDIAARRSVPHFVAGVFFEQLQNCDINSNDAEITNSLVDLVQAVLKSTTRHLNERYGKTTVDIVAESEHDRQMHAIISENARMAIGLAGAVVMTARMNEETSSALSRLRSLLLSFTVHIDNLKCKEETYINMANDAHELLSVFGDVVLTRNPVDLLPKMSESCIDIVESIRKGLMDDSPVTRGSTLLKIGQLIRARQVVILSELDKWLFEMMKDLILDADSYVYLAAINSLAEAACYGSTYLRELITLFKDFSSSETIDKKVSAHVDGIDDGLNDDNLIGTRVILRSRICEVLGKVFRVLGDMSPVWMDESAGVFLSCFKDEDEIIRSSALSSFAELVLACRGRNLEKYIEEILFAMESFLMSDNSSLVKRATVHFIRQLIKSCDTNLIEIVGGRLRNLQRELLHMWRWDKDHVVRLHAELALDEIRVAIKAMVIQETTYQSRVVS